MSLIVVKDASNNKLRELECDSTGKLLVVNDVSALATQATLSAMDAKITACDTANIAGAVSVTGNVAITAAALPLPSGAASEASMAIVAGAVVAGVVQVSTGIVSASSSVVFAAASIAAGFTTKSSSFDADAYRSVCIFGNTTNLEDSNIDIEVSADDVAYFELNNEYLSVDYLSGDFGVELPLSARYVRISRTNNTFVGETISAHISGK